MSDTSKLISELNTKLDELISKYAESKTSNDKKVAEIEGLTKKLSEKEQLIAKMEADLKNALETSEKVQIVEKVVESPSKDSEQLKLRINELVSEIDNCISLLKV